MNNGKICVSVCAATVDQLFENIGRASDFADVIEVRFDCLDPSELQMAAEHLPDPRATYLFTFRPKNQGGSRDISLAERRNFWELIFNHHTANYFIDIEGDDAAAFDFAPDKVKRILSQHDFERVPSGLDNLFDELTSQGDVAKIAVATDEAVDAISLWKLLDRAEKAASQVIPIAMGEAGKWTRILGPAHGAFFSYASLGTGDETAPGQVTAREMAELYRVRELDRATKVYGIIGDPISGSLSTYIHNPAFVFESVNAVFIPFPVKDLNEFMNRMVMLETREVELNFGGFAVTMPHKQSIMKYLDAIDPTAERIGAVNTIKFDGSKLTGYNTDAYGFITPLKQHFGDLKGANVAVFGAGGAARACIHALKQENADVMVFARFAEKAAALGEEFGVGSGSIPNGDSLTCDVLVDTTPFGMSGTYENDSLFRADELKGVKFVYDLVTKAYDTPIIQEAKKAGVPAIGGIEMLVAQGAMQFEIWTGRAAPLEKMRQSVSGQIRLLQK